jgi:hypothetical protein
MGYDSLFVTKNGQKLLENMFFAISTSITSSPHPTTQLRKYKKKHLSNFNLQVHGRGEKLKTNSVCTTFLRCNVITVL